MISQKSHNDPKDLGPLDRLRQDEATNPIETDAPHRAFAGFGTATVIRAGWKQVLLDRTPLSPSKPSCAGDQGTVNGVLVTDVVQEDGGFLHVLDEHLELEPGARVRIWMDPIRHDRLERAHTMTIVALAELSRAGAAVTSAEIVAGLAWIEMAGPVPSLDFRKVVEDDHEIEILGRRAGHIAVFLQDRIIDTVDAPFAARTGSIAGAEVSAITTLEGGYKALEIALPDGDGECWWR